MPFPTNTGSGKAQHTPDSIEILVQRPTEQTTAGYVTQTQYRKESYEPTGTIFPAYVYLATGRYLSTSTTPLEYGIGDTKDYMMALIYIEGKTKEEIATLKVDTIVKVHRKDYTLEENGKLYRLVTGNPYSDHFEFRMIPWYD